MDTSGPQDFQPEATEKNGPAPSMDSSEGPNGPRNQPLAQRDAGVSVEIWNQLQLDRKKAEEAEKELQRMIEEERKLKQWLKACADVKRQKELEELERKRREAAEKRRQDAKAKQ